MAQHQHLPIYKAAYDLLIQIMRMAGNFPREFRYSLGERLQSALIELVMDVYRANSAYDKAAGIKKLLDDAQLVNVHLRIAHDLKVITTERYGAFILMIDSVSKQASGWLNSVEGKGEKPKNGALS